MSVPSDSILEAEVQLPQVSIPSEPLDEAGANGTNDALDDREGTLDRLIDHLCRATAWDRHELASYIGCKHPTAEAMRRLGDEEFDLSLRAVRLMVRQVDRCGSEDAERVRSAAGAASDREVVAAKRDGLELVREVLMMVKGDATVGGRIFSELRGLPERMVDEDHKGSAHKLVRRAVRIAQDPDSMWTEEDGTVRALRLSGEPVVLGSSEQFRDALAAGRSDNR